MSGGVDSSVAAALLKRRGYRVMGVMLRLWSEEGREDENRCCTIDALQEARYVAGQLDIPFYALDAREAFRKTVVENFINGYAQGITPNPCLVCNPSIKFDLLFQHARSLGAQRLATGHYARIERLSDGRLGLLRGVDSRKDQSYFLARLTQKQLATALMPLGNQTKAQTRTMARQMGLITTSSGESQDVCFIRDSNYGDFIARQPDFAAVPGPIEDIQGRMIGEHLGLHRFTVGQRRGINCPAAAPYYVVRLEPSRNCLVVGGKQDLLVPDCRVDHINWIALPPQEPIRVQARLRYRHRAVPSQLSPIGDSSAVIRFDTPQSAVTPGQGAVFYHEDVVLGSGWIQ